MPSYSNHPRSHWFDAARMLRSASSKIQKAADVQTSTARTELVRQAQIRLIREAQTQIDAALTRLKDAE